MPNSLDHAASKAMGAVKTIQAEIEGLSGVFTELAKEHSEAGVLLKRLKSSSNADTRRELYEDVRKQLMAHERGELAEVYPVLSRHQQTRQIAKEHEEQAGELESAIRVLDATHPTAPDWQPALERLIALVERHVHDEEKNYFPLAQKVIGKDESKALKERYENAKKAELERLEERPAGTF